MQKTLLQTSRGSISKKHTEKSFHFKFGGKKKYKQQKSDFKV